MNVERPRGVEMALEFVVRCVDRLVSCCLSSIINISFDYYYHPSFSFSLSLPLLPLFLTLEFFGLFRLNFSMISHACNCGCVCVCECVRACVSVFVYFLNKIFFVFDIIERVRRAMNAFGYFICERRKEEGNKSKKCYK